MKTILVVICTAFILVSVGAKDINTQIGGIYEGDIKGKIIQLCRVEHGKPQQVEVVRLDDKGQFEFKVAIERPELFVVKVLSDKHKNEVRGERGLKRFYLEKGDEISIKLEDDAYELLKPVDERNNVLSKWNNVVDTIYSAGYNTHIDYKTYFPLLPEFVETVNKFKKEIRTNDADFNELMNLLVDTDLNVSALYFIYSMHSIHPTRDLYPDYYQYIVNEQAPKSERLLELPMGSEYIRLYTLHAALTEIGDRKADADELKELALSKIESDLLKGYYLIEGLHRYRSYDDSYMVYKKEIAPYLLNNYLKEKVAAFEKTIREFEKGTPAIDFTGIDVNGKVHKLSDYKGKLVYVDVWATWCGPCKAEIPALKALEEKYHDKPIIFLSISVDKSKDRSKWQAFVEDKELKGVQLIADDAFNSKVARAYKITGIPRFMLFDTDGNIITTDAPRPSDNNLETLLNHNF